MNDYLNSTNYNRVGTSVKFDHTTEPTAEQMTYVDGYSKEQKTVTYEYPTASKTLYGKALNDHLTKLSLKIHCTNSVFGIGNVVGFPPFGITIL